MAKLMGVFRWRWIALVLVVCLMLEWVVPALAQTVSPEGPQQVLPAGTRFSVTLKQTLVSGKGKTGEPVSFAVTNDVLAPDGKTVLVARDTPALGVLKVSDGPKNFGRPGKLAFTCDVVNQGDGGQIPVRLISPENRKGNDLRPLLWLIGLPFYLYGIAWIYDDATSDYGWFDGLGQVAGTVIVGIGFLVQTLLGAVIRGKRVTVSEGTAFVVEVLARTGP